MRLALTRMIVLMLGLAACSAPGDDAPDAALAVDASMARDAEIDAAMGFDGSTPPDAAIASDGATSDAGDWGPCTAAGIPGRCIEVATCTGVATPGLCPGPADIQCCTVSPSDGGPPSDGSIPRDGSTSSTCDPDARPLPNEGLTEEPGEDGCPAGMVRIDAAVCIDRFEASLVEVLPNGATRGFSPFVEPAGVRVRAVSLRGAVPQGYIRQTQAAAACAEAGKRLCTDAEWLLACRGPSDSTYPYGDTRMPGVCNDARARHPAVEYFGTGEDWIWSELDHACLNQLPDSLARTGDHPMCESTIGALDMMGNLHEWTADPAGTFRGGYYVDTMINGPGCLYRTTAHDVSHRDYSTGFRCCASAAE